MRILSSLSLNDCQVGLTDLLDKRLPALKSTKAGNGQLDVLIALKTETDALPEALTGKRPLADELAAVDDKHDGFGGTLWFVTEGHLRLPNLDPKIREAALRVRAAFIPELGELNAGYADEAAKAERREENLVKYEADLKLFPIAGGKTLHDVATSYISAGGEISKLISQRADINAATRNRASTLRSEIVGALNDLRRAITRETKRGAALPANIDAEIFGYFDTLEEQRKAANRAEKKSGEPQEKPQ